jgi:hypothetical protein
MGELKQAIEKINNLDRNVERLSLALLGDERAGIEGFCGRLVKVEKQSEQHENYFKRVSGAAALLGMVWAAFAVFWGGRK